MDDRAGFSYAVARSGLNHGFGERNDVLGGVADHVVPSAADDGDSIGVGYQSGIWWSIWVARQRNEMR